MRSTEGAAIANFSRRMPSEVKKRIELEIVHVLFSRHVGYSKLLINEQRAVLEVFNAIGPSPRNFRAADSASQAGLYVHAPQDAVANGK